MCSLVWMAVNRKSGHTKVEISLDHKPMKLGNRQIVTFSIMSQKYSVWRHWVNYYETWSLTHVGPEGPWRVPYHFIRNRNIALQSSSRSNKWWIEAETFNRFTPKMYGFLITQKVSVRLVGADWVQIDCSIIISHVACQRASMNHEGDQHLVCQTMFSSGWGWQLGNRSLGTDFSHPIHTTGWE